MYEILMIVYLVVAIALVGFILIQQGKGAGMGSAFGSGASGTVFGASGSGNFLTKTTTILAIVFFGVALGLGNLTSDNITTDESNTLFDGVKTEQPVTDLPVEAEEIPAVDDSIADDLPSDDLPLEEGTDETNIKPEESTENSSEQGGNES